MLKDILIKSAELLNRDDIISELKSQNDTLSSGTSLANDIYRLINYFNYTLQNLCEHYFPISHIDVISSDKNRKIYYNSFSFQPLKIISVSSNNTNKCFTETSSYILTPAANTNYNVTYNYLPESISDLNQSINIPGNINTKIICYGIASEFLASKNMLDESNYWHNKFMYEIYKSKTNSNKRLKATFSI